MMLQCAKTFTIGDYKIHNSQFLLSSLSSNLHTQYHLDPWKLIVFLKINKDYKVNITSFIKNNEYIFIEKKKRDKILKQYKKAGYRVSRTQRLNLYRSLIIFQKLVDSGISPKRINCFGLQIIPEKKN